ncbi:hypothetical protein Pint_22153 [Pistacia integerrima]|uniref:Uncharacterized protein n=1 Tax=Pistacia integerrima TaxID=434235 RepID=A0ACC0YP49_9ROSI|nr:hypothetical protein Pint_22153 [Pistacia integerrima]
MHYKDSVQSVSPNPVKTKSTPGMLTWKSSGTCRLPYGSLSADDILKEFSITFSFGLELDEYQYQVCSLNAVTPIYYRPYELFGNNTYHYETIRKSLRSGFNLTWSFERRDCLAPDGMCSVRGGTTGYSRDCKKSETALNLVIEFLRFLRRFTYDVFDESIPWLRMIS